MNNSPLRNIQLLQMVIMDDIHRICVENNLRYYLIGGSALGAVRHDGFIPWDPDIDIAMPRDDYELFVTKYSKQLKPIFSCRSHYTDRDYYPPHALVLLNGSRLDGCGGNFDKMVRPTEVYVDVLPLDSWPKDAKKKVRQQRLLRVIKEIKYRKLSIVYKNDTFPTKVIKHTAKILLKPIPWRPLNVWQQNSMKKYRKNPSDDWCSMASHYSFDKLTMHKSIFGVPTLRKFDNREYYVPEHVEQYLVHLFGEYMNLPPIEEQKRLANLFESVSWPEGLI